MGIADEALRIGALFEARYEILAELGHGSFGRVFKARQVSTGQLVAIKILRALDATPGELKNLTARFRLETQLCAELWHPNIVRLVDSGEAGSGELYAVFDFVPGATLREILNEEHKLEVAEAVHLMAQVLDALSCAHARGIVHRDVKPENLIVTKTGMRRNASVLDFGLGGFVSDAARRSQPRLTAANEILGTPCYAAPEQLRGEATTPLSDLYSWGLVFLECLTGEMAVRGASPQAVVQRQLGPDPISIPDWLRSHALGPILELVTAKQASRRSISAEAVLRALLASETGALAAGPPPPRDEVESDLRRRQLTVVCFRFTVTAANEADVEEMARALRARHAELTDRARQVGGTVAAIAGDRMLVVFGYPRAREDDTRRAARFAVEFAADASPTGAVTVDVGCGLHSGLVVVREPRRGDAPNLREVTGLTPEIAIQLAERAAPGETLVTPVVEHALRNDFDSELAEECRIRELSRPLAVSRLRGRRRGAGESASRLWSRATPLVGRSTQLQQLLDAWANARARRGGVAILIGEAGIGKSRLLQELRQRESIDAEMEWSCAPESQTTPLRPVTDALVAIDPSAESLLSRFGLDLEENLPLFAALLSLPPDERYPPLPSSPDRHKELTLRALVRLCVEMARQRPFLLAIENLHWADATTLELAGLLAEEIRTANQIATQEGPKLLVVCTTRPELIPAWGEDVSLLPLQRLLPADVEAMARASLPEGATLATELVQRVSQRAEGVPLFVEELMRSVADSATAAGDVGAVDVAIPGSLRELLTSRLDRVSPAARDTAQLAAVLGREFGNELLEVLSGRDAAFVRHDLDELGRAGLVLRRRSGRNEEFFFRHALLRDAAYEAMTKPKRRDLHRRVANVLREHFPAIGQRRPEVLARHFEEGGEIREAATHWHQAGLLALGRAAYVEALQQLARGEALVSALDASPERSRLEVELLTALGTAHVSTRGFGAEEVRPIFARARSLCEELGDQVSLQVLGGIYGAGVTTGDPQSTEEILPHFRRLAERAGEPAAAFAGNQVLGVQSFWIGEPSAARIHLSRAMELYRREEVQGLAWEYGYGLYCYGYGVLTLFQLGLPDLAEATRREMTDFAEASHNPYCMAIALGFGLTLTRDRGEVDLTADLAERLLALANEQHLYFWASFAHCGLGAALQRRGRPDEGVARIRQGLELLKMLGVRSSYAYYLTFLASASLDAGRIDEGLAAVDESMALADVLIARTQVPELWRLRGELCARRGERSEAEAAIRRSIALSRERGAKGYELRGLTSLARLLERERASEARESLRALCAELAEGSDTADVRAAKSLL